MTPLVHFGAGMHLSPVPEMAKNVKNGDFRENYVLEPRKTVIFVIFTKITVFARARAPESSKMAKIDVFDHFLSHFEVKKCHFLVIFEKA